MSNSAGTSREDRRRELHDRVRRTSRRLAIEHGFDGYTMDDLAAEVGVSRRTLFNHFPTKEATIFGVRDVECEEPDEHLLEEFVAGRPSGHLLEDMVALCATSLREDDPISATDVREMLVVLHENPSLRDAFHRRLDELVSQIAEPVAQRLRVEPSAPVCRLAVQVLRGIVVEAATDFAHSDGSTPLDQILTEYAQILRSLD